MEEAIKNFAKQFEFEPEIKNAENLKKDFKQIVVAGMGGSHLSTGLLKIWKPGIDLYVHRSYELPPFSDEFLKESLLIASSYSGNTEEVVSFLNEGLAKGFSMAVIAVSGKLIDIAKEFNVPYIQIPDTGIQPRSALGFSLVALAKFLGNDALSQELKQLSSLQPESQKASGEELANDLKGFVPIIYSSVDNLAIAYNWKIKFNETGKIPAFYNVFPELNHNELAGFDVIDTTRDLSKNFRFVFLKDRDDHERIQKRMDVMEKLLENRGLEVIVLELEGESIFEKIFNSLLLADWTALSLSKLYGTEPDKVEIIEEFKKKLSP